jgi:uncharacterized protein (DUF927 family)
MKIEDRIEKYLNEDINVLSFAMAWLSGAFMGKYLFNKWLKWLKKKYPDPTTTVSWTKEELIEKLFGDDSWKKALTGAGYTGNKAEEKKKKMFQELLDDKKIEEVSPGKFVF